MANTGPTAWNFPDLFVGKAILSAYVPYEMYSGSFYTSNATNVAGGLRWNQPQPVAVKNIVMQHSMNAGVPAATSQASTGSGAYSYALSAFVYTRQDWAANSSVAAFVTSASVGLTATLGYSSTSQQFGMSWVTDSTGGIANLTTTSNDAGWSNFVTGAKVVNMPFVSTLTAGEYWLLFQQASTSATSNSNVTLLSFSQAMLNNQFGNGGGLVNMLSQSGAPVLSNGGWAAPAIGVNGLVTTSATQGTTALAGLVRPLWFAMSGA